MQSSVKAEECSTGESSCTKDAVKTEAALTPLSSNSKAFLKETTKDKVLEIKSEDSFADPNSDLLLHLTSSSTSSSSVTPINKTGDPSLLLSPQNLIDKELSLVLIHLSLLQ